MYSIYQENKDLVLMGGYSKGQNEEIDMAMESWPKICELLKQDYKTKSNFSDCFKKLDKIMRK
jgi:flagellum-specific ATP synthase